MAKLNTGLNISKAEWMTTGKERKSYYMYFTGQNIFYNIVTLFLATYLLFLGVDPIKSAIVMLIVKIWDALNDAVFGCLFDKVKFKSGKKFVPWLRIAVGMLPLTTIFMFVIPQGSSEAVKLGWFAAAYLLWDTFYTLCDAPAFGMVTTMTSKLDERESIISFSRIAGGVGMGIAYLVCNVLISEKVGLSFGVCAIILAVIGFATMLPLCINGKERTLLAPGQNESPTIRAMLKYVVKNKYLLIFFLGSFFYGAMAAGGSISLFVSFYLFNNSLFGLLIAAIAVVPVLLFAIIIPRIIKRIDKYKLFMICNVIYFAMSIIIWAIGYKNVTVYFVLAAIRGVPLASSGILMLMFTPDCAEYGRFKTGTDAKGITFSFQTFMAKITAAVSGSLGLFLLGFFNWQSVDATNFKELAEAGVTQTQQALNGLWFTHALMPAIGVGIAIVVWIFYRLRDRDVQIMTDCNQGLISREEALSKIKIKL